MAVIEQQQEMSATDMGATYAEARDWIVWLHTFTAHDLADAMAVSDWVGMQFTKAATYHGIIKDTGDGIDEEDGNRYPIYAYIDPPVTHREHHTETPPELDRHATPGVYDEAPVRGYPVRLLKEDRKGASTSGVRHRIELRKQRYQEMQDAIAKRKAEQARILKENPDSKQARKHKKNSIAVST